MVAAQAESKKADADLMKAENDKTRLMIDGAKLEQSGQKLTIEEGKAVADIRNKDASTFKTIAETKEIDADVAAKQMEAMIQNMPTEELVRLLQ